MDTEIRKNLVALTTKDSCWDLKAASALRGVVSPRTKKILQGAKRPKHFFVQSHDESVKLRESLNFHALDVCAERL